MRKGYSYSTGDALKKDIIVAFIVGKAETKKKKKRKRERYTTNLKDTGESYTNLEGDTPPFQCEIKVRMNRCLEGSKSLLSVHVVCTNNIEMDEGWFCQSAKFFYQGQALKQINCL